MRSDLWIECLFLLNISVNVKIGKMSTYFNNIYKIELQNMARNQKNQVRMRYSYLF